MLPGRTGVRLTPLITVTPSLESTPLENAKMKKILIALALIAMLAVAAVSAALFLTRGLVEPTDAFFAAVRDGRSDEAWSMLSQGFRDGTDPAALARFLDQQQMRRVQRAEWNRRAVENGQGRLEGALVTDSGGRIPVAIDLVEEDGEWRIHRIERSAAGLVDGGRPGAPDTDTAVALVRSTTGHFFDALADGSMARFHAEASSLWRAQHAVADLDGAYRAFLGLDIDLAPLRGAEPVLEGLPRIDDDGVLHLNAHLSSEHGLFRFGLRYVLENGRWMPLGLNVRVE
ncbi:hypothetical protein WM2015_2446 [Wenzhouxiangella marina]|uniref:DUF4864 domain-containing protein n=2 Tax=Wenzhouxiangella marina TaxID=1579979 RepID=A0A0K0XYP3_9GAMM|nr:hypothetical protein WM2015_2446 [Wenzhouxiangella marina]